MFALKEVVPTGPPVFFRQGPTGETHISGGLWIVDKTIHVGAHSSVVGSIFTWNPKLVDPLLYIDLPPSPPYEGIYLTPGRYTLWGRFLQLHLIRWLRFARATFAQARFTAHNKCADYEDDDVQ